MKTKKQKKEPAGTGEIVFLGIDAEYEKLSEPAIDTGNGDPKKKKADPSLMSNRVLSFQFFGLFGEQAWKGIRYLEGKRITFRDLISDALDKGVKSGVLRKRPHRIILCAHFSIAEVSVLKDRDELMRKLDYCKKTFSTFFDHLKVSYHDCNRNSHDVTVVWRDSWLMAPTGHQSLEKIGKLLGIPKIDIAPYKKEEMSRLLEGDRELFERYAITDAEIAARYMKRMTDFARALFGEAEPPATIGSCATKLTLDTWKRESIVQHTVLGTYVRKVNTISKTGKPVKRNEVVPLAIRSDYEEYARSSFVGGRNETFLFGPSPEEEFLDLDLKGAYVSALACIGTPEWHKLRPTTELHDFTLGVIGFACVKFCFPTGTRFPCLPVRMETGIIFPMAGECYATAPEIMLARNLGAELEILRGCMMPMCHGSHPFATIARRVAGERSQFQKQEGKGGLMDLLMKTIGNSVYGKLAQAVRPKKAFSTRVRRMEEMQPSAITNAYLAATVTGIIRAVLGEILAALPENTCVASVTTDGFLSDLPEGVIGTVTDGPLCRYFTEGRRRIGEEGPIVEVKHRAQQVMSWRTRGQATLIYDDPKELILAKAGIQTPRDLGFAEQNDHIITRFINRKAGDEFTVHRLRSGKDICEDGGDLVGYEGIVHHRMDFDWKRAPTYSTERPIRDVMHLCFETRPLRDREEFLQLRESWEGFYARYDQPLKRLEDFNDFLEFASIRETGKMQIPRKGSSTFVARRAFLTAYARSLWGFRCELSNAELARTLTENGYATEVHEVENSRRPTTPLHANCVGRTPSVLGFIEFLRKCFPGCEPEILASA